MNEKGFSIQCSVLGIVKNINRLKQFKNLGIQAFQKAATLINYPNGM